MKFPILIGLAFLSISSAQAEQGNSFLADVEQVKSSDSVTSYFAHPAAEQLPRIFSETFGKPILESPTQSQLLDCQDPSLDGHLSVANMKCQPDTLYSWGSIDKIRLYKKLMGKTSWVGRLKFKASPTTTARKTFYQEGDPTPIYTVPSPLGSVGYGQYSVRIKLKKLTQFKVITGWQPAEQCKTLSDDEVSKTVLVRTFEMPASDQRPSAHFQEFLICSTDVIESWSYGTSRHYDELVRDANYLISGTVKNLTIDAALPIKTPQYHLPIPKDYISYGRSAQHPALIEPDSGTDFSLAHLDTRLINQLSLVNQGAGYIFYNPALTDVPRTEAQHFFSKWNGMIYFFE